MKKTSKSTKVAPTPTAIAAAAKTAAKKVMPKKKAPVAVAATPVRRSAPAATKIIALIDVGFGNTLYVRGEGPGLSWDKGVPLDCVIDDQWTFALKGVTKPVVFKLLINDLSWSAGEDYSVKPGESLTVTPTF